MRRSDLISHFHETVFCHRSVTMGAWAFREGRYDVAADFAVRMSFRVYVDVPLAHRKLPVLLRSQNHSSGYRIFHRTALFGQQTKAGAFLPGWAGPWN
jgi:hypothetical protein